MPDLPFVTRPSDARQHRQAHRLEDERARQVAESLRVVLGTTEGRLLLWSLFVERAGLYDALGDGADLLYVAGRRDFALAFRALALEHDPDGWALAEREATQRAARVQRQRREFEEQQRARTRDEET